MDDGKNLDVAIRKKREREKDGCKTRQTLGYNIQGKKEPEVEARG